MGDGPGNVEGAGERTLKFANRKQPQAKDCLISFQVEGELLPYLPLQTQIPNAMPVIPEGGSYTGRG